jgi:hypothetical protein
VPYFSSVYLDAFMKQSASSINFLQDCQVSTQALLLRIFITTSMQSKAITPLLCTQVICASIVASLQANVFGEGGSTRPLMTIALAATYIIP